ncbi:hypothetical protein E2C01_085685 [Portunus trituberculatus]|uniref:Uncharacterized protein n=1 Tax=Portunus trituberculatus TaxID=210409 RepID=A0A5B7JCL6_PORTR|nr:hypothetical protein [Portunus trituberculatus]
MMSSVIGQQTPRLAISKYDYRAETQHISEEQHPALARLPNNTPAARQGAPRYFGIFVGESSNQY